jgi:hypothetical protein
LKGVLKSNFIIESMVVSAESVESLSFLLYVGVFSSGQKRASTLWRRLYSLRFLVEEVGVCRGIWKEKKRKARMRILRKTQKESVYWRGSEK